MITNRLGYREGEEAYMVPLRLNISIVIILKARFAVRSPGRYSTAFLRCRYVNTAVTVDLNIQLTLEVVCLPLCKVQGSTS